MENHKIKVLLQTTIPMTEDDWHIERFSMLRDYLASLQDEAGNPLCEVVARNREADAIGNDPVLSTLDQSDFDEMWLFAVDTGNGLTEKECAAIGAFREKGGGLLLTRDHQDLGSSICNLAGIGSAHYFHTRNLDPDAARQAIDDVQTNTISWPNYHSGRNGDYQVIAPVEPVHELLRNPAAPGGTIQFFPAHPHEGGVGIPAEEKHARVVAMGKSLVTQRPFNLMVAFERPADTQTGRAIAEASFHHFADYNWNPELGAPSFVSEPVGDGVQGEPRALEDIKAYVGNVARWLAAK